MKGFGPMDAVDRQLIQALRENGRASYAELGRLVGLSGPSVTDRINRLEAAGVITGYRATVNAASLGLGVTALIGIQLSDAADQAWLGGLAHEVRTRKNGDVVHFNVNRHLNMTNVCTASCAYCSFQRKPGEKDAYTMRIEEAVRLAKAMESENLTELHIVNGLHPTLPWRYYPRSLRALKEALPDTVSLKAFTATEIH